MMKRFKWSDVLKKIPELIASLKSRGFFHILVSSTLVKVVSFISVIFLQRFLPKADYGLLSYVDTVRNYILLINGIGISNATIRYCSGNDSDEKRKTYFLASILVGVAADVVLILASVIAFSYIEFPYEGANSLLILSSVIPLFIFLYEDISFLLRAALENRKYSLLSFAYSILMVILQIVLAVLWNLKGVIVARYIALALSLLIGVYFIKDLSVIKAKTVLPDKKIIAMTIRFGVVMMAGNAASIMMTYNENLIIAQVLADKTIQADYAAASYITIAAQLLLQSLTIFIYPYFVRHIDDKQWIWSRFKKIFVLNAAVMIPVHILLFACAKWIILLLSGAKYLDAVPIMHMLLIASLSQTLFRGLAGNILVGIGQENFNLIINIIFTVIHYFLDLWAIQTCGIKGAAIALIIVYTVSGIVMCLRLRKMCKKGLPQTE